MSHFEHIIEKIILCYKIEKFVNTQIPTEKILTTQVIAINMASLLKTKEKIFPVKSFKLQFKKTYQTKKITTL